MSNSKLSIQIHAATGITNFADGGKFLKLKIVNDENEGETPPQAAAAVLEFQNTFGFSSVQEDKVEISLLGDNGKVISKGRFLCSNLKEGINNLEVEMEPAGTLTMVVTESKPPPATPKYCSILIRSLGLPDSVPEDFTLAALLGDVRTQTYETKRSLCSRLEKEFVFEYREESEMTVEISVKGEPVLSSTLDLWMEIEKKGNAKGVTKTGGDLNLLDYNNMTNAGKCDITISLYNDESEKLAHFGLAVSSSSSRKSSVVVKSISEERPAIITRGGSTSSSSSPSSSHPPVSSSSSSSGSGETWTPELREMALNNARGHAQSANEEVDLCDDFLKHLDKRVKGYPEGDDEEAKARHHAAECHGHVKKVNKHLNDYLANPTDELCEDLAYNTTQNGHNARSSRHECLKHVTLAFGHTTNDETKKAKRAAHTCRALMGNFSEAAEKHACKEVNASLDAGREQVKLSIQAAKQAKYHCKVFVKTAFPGSIAAAESTHQERLAAEKALRILEGLFAGLPKAIAKHEKIKEKKARLIDEARLLANIKLERKLSDERHERFLVDFDRPMAGNHEIKYVENHIAASGHDFFSGDFGSVTNTNHIRRSNLKAYQKIVIEGEGLAGNDKCVGCL